jgi:tRNA-Thr(GGU) m(6)t(6)A37 methyltransferase TsaA
MEESICYQPIGFIRTPFTQIAGMPIQAVAARGVTGRIELLPEFVEGLTDIEGFSHLILVYHLHLMHGYKLTVTPYLDNVSHGIFATRSPKRPNPIGLSVVRLLGVEQAKALLHIEEIDVLDGTPLLDIKPYVPHFDNRPTEVIGWFADKVERVEQVRADQRFQQGASEDKGKSRE